MSASTITLSREQLYSLVWEKPVRTLAQEFGISDVALAKRCRRLKIPLPGVGDWAKIQHGKEVERPPLPPLPEGAERSTHFTECPDNILTRSGGQSTPAPPRTQVLDKLTDPHPLIMHTRELLLRTEPGADGIVRLSDPSALPVEVSPAERDRALRIMDALLRVFEARGYGIRTGTGHKPELHIVIDEEPIPITLTEGVIETAGMNRSPPAGRGIGRPYPSDPQKTERPSGTLTLHIETHLWSGMRQNWSDGTKVPLERALSSFLTGLVKIVPEVRTHRLEAQERARRARERKKLIDAHQLEKDRLDEFNREVNAWCRANEMRAYIDAVRRMIVDRDGGVAPGSIAEEWLEWAERQADRQDPLVESPPSILDQPPPSQYGW